MFVVFFVCLEEFVELIFGGNKFGFVIEDIINGLVILSILYSGLGIFLFFDSIYSRLLKFL